MPSDLDDLLTSRQVAERLGVDISTISRMVSSGRLVPRWSAPGRTGVKLFHPDDLSAATPEPKAS